MASWHRRVATVSLVKSADRNAERQLRAYVVADPKGVVTFSGSENATMVAIQVVIKNTGQTPAHDLRIVSKTELLPHPIKMPFNFTLISGPEPSASILGAGELSESESKPNEPFDGNAMMVAREPEAGGRIYTWGTVTYRDVTPTTPIFAAASFSPMARLSPTPANTTTMPINAGQPALKGAET